MLYEKFKVKNIHHIARYVSLVFRLPNAIDLKFHRLLAFEVKTNLQCV